MRLLCSFAFLAAAAFAADISGKWSGEAAGKGPDGTVHAERAFMVLKVDGDTVTGTGGPGEDQQYPLRKGVLNGNKFTAELVNEQGRVFALEFTVEGDTMTGTVRGQTSAGEPIVVEAKLKRVSEAAAAEATGRWAGRFDMTMDGESREETALLILKQEGSRISGTAGPDEERQMTIRAGSIEGQNIQLEIEPEQGPIIYLALKVDGVRMTGDARANDSEHKMTGKLDLKREK